jgi:hypothetical protein
VVWLGYPTAEERRTFFADVIEELESLPAMSKEEIERGKKVRSRKRHLDKEVS